MMPIRILYEEVYPAHHALIFSNFNKKCVINIYQNPGKNENILFVGLSA